jgi:hypothetical protein
MARSITIRDVPDEVCDELKARAAADGCSFEEYLRRHVVELARRPESDVVLHRVRARVARTGGRLSADSILRHRDADRR